MSRMNLLIKGLLIALWCITPCVAEAILTTKVDDPGIFETGIKPLQVSKGAVPWEKFAQTKSTEKEMSDLLGKYFVLLPHYSADIKALDGQVVTLMGYMFPLQEAEKQSDFLFGPFPPSCPFHYHVNPNQVVEVVTSKPIKFSYHPIRIKGRLHLTPKDPNGVFYILRQAQLDE
ncbi:MAG: DUF3299 domain-containing protein [Alphaproteobacteria bacterium]|nr:DUF3299 domain-containing protein [Alphaproteobacteria bacterium]